MRWTGMVSHADAVAELAAGDVLALTSVQEGTPHVVLEALSLGLPVVCHDACGMGIVVTDECGIKVPLVCPEASIAGFERAIRQLAADPIGCAWLSAGALRRSQDLGWEALARVIAQRYDEVLSGSPSLRIAPRQPDSVPGRLPAHPAPPSKAVSVSRSSAST